LTNNIKKEKTMANYTKHLSKKITPQTEVIPGREKEMVVNDAGGFVFEIDRWKLLDRFLILGAEGPTYYVSEKKLIEDNTKNLKSCILEDGVRVVKRIVEISDEARAPKNDPAIFALAMVMTYGDKAAKNEAIENFNKVCRIGTHLFTFVYYIDELRSWGRVVRKAISKWYNSRSKESLEMQLIKYKGRTVEGTKNQWTHRDVLRSAHVMPKTNIHNALFSYAVKGEFPINVEENYSSEIFPTVFAHDALYKNVENIELCKKLIEKNKLPHDVWPTELKNHKIIWETALKDIPMTALIRNLGKLTNLGILHQGKFDEVNYVIDKITNVDELRKARIHPYNILMAMITYNHGRGFKGDLSWHPVKKIVDALEESFYNSFKLIEPTNKRILIGLDVSSSMVGTKVMGSPLLDCRTAAAVMAMTTIRTEKNYEVMAFSDKFVDFDITANSKLNEVITDMNNMPFGRTDCSLPMKWAVNQKIQFDAFIVYTDNETYSGIAHPIQALKEYRNKFVKDAKLIVVGFEGRPFSMADPSDPGCLDIVGFDSAGPQIISEFIKGNI